MSPAQRLAIVDARPVKVDPEATRTLLGRIAAVATATLAAGSVLVTAGMWPLNAEWMPAFVGLVGLYAVLTYGLWTGRSWSRFTAMGVSIWGLACFLEASIFLGIVPLTLTGLALHALVLIFAGLMRAEAFDRRHAFALVMASAAVPSALIYGLAPQHDWLTTAGVLGGAGVVVAATAGLGRGKTWGLLAALFGAGLIAVTIAFARHVGWLVHPHPILPNENPLALLGLGVAAATFAFGAAVPYLGPIVRFLVRDPA